MARRIRLAAAATDAAILTRGSDFTESKGTAGIEGGVRRRPGIFTAAPGDRRTQGSLRLPVEVI